jgi:serine/threonine-protein kinase
METLGEIERLAGPTPETGEPLPERLSGYKILGLIGSGGMGRVLLAADEKLGRHVAIKTLLPRYAGDGDLRARFMREARALAAISHPNVARIYQLGPPEEPPHFVMEYLEGAPLTRAAQPLSLRQKVELMLRVVTTLAYLHERGLIHRDLKPANILVGADLEPKLLDFGLVLPLEERGQLSLPGHVMGTPDYFSPEQARADAKLDARSDVFSLGTILYELLTGTLPFSGTSLVETMHNICTQDPVLPRRRNRNLPGELQNICLKALEKNPAHRYASAQDLAADLERYLAGEAVLAAPTSYSRLMAGKIEQHLRDLGAWKDDHVLSAAEHDRLRKAYSSLVEPEDAWILEARRLSLPQVSLYLGAWILAVGAFLIVLFRYAGLSGTAAVLVAATAASATGWSGVRLWRAARFRIAVAYLLAFCLLLPIALLVAMSEYGWLTAPSRGQESLEFFAKFESFKRTTNAQLWWAILLALPAYLWLRRFTRSSVFSLVLGVMGALLCWVTLLRMGLLDWLENDPGRPYFYLIPAAAIYLSAGWRIERSGRTSDSRYFYPIAVGFTFLALSGLAAMHQPYADWLKATAPWTRGQHEYLFIINAGIYYALQRACERFDTPQMRMVAKSYRFVIPGHVLTSLLLLGIEASKQEEHLLEARTFQVVLPLAACIFVFASIPEQMKNFFATGMLFLAIGIVRLQQDLLKDRALWPISLLLLGLMLMLAAANYTPLKRLLTRPWSRR